MISIAEAAKDESIFRPDGFIVIPRSDGDPTYIPSNMIRPPPSAAEVNYYHEFKHDDEKHHRWRSTIGEQLAKWFKLPSRKLHFPFHHCLHQHGILTIYCAFLF